MPDEPTKCLVYAEYEILIFLYLGLSVFDLPSAKSLVAEAQIEANGLILGSTTTVVTPTWNKKCLHSALGLYFS